MTLWHRPLLLALALALTLALLAASTPILDSDPAWHLPLIGPPVPKNTQTSPSLAFLRHPDSSVRLSGRLPSLIVTATQSNVLAALNPRNGSIIWRIVLPETEPIIQHATHLDNGVIGLVSGHGGITVRLINLADGRALWERHLNDPKHSDSEATWLGINGVDVIFGTDQASATSSRPDLIVASRASTVSRLAGDSGKVRWTWSSSQSLGSVARLLRYPASIPQLEVLTVKASAKTGSYETLVSTLSTANGELQSTRSHPDHKCLDTPEGPLVLDLPPDSATQLQHSIVCATDSGNIASLGISSDTSQDLRLSIYTDPEQQSVPVIIQDVGLAGHGISVARFQNGQATVLRLAGDGTLKSAWQFTDQNRDAVFTGSIDRDGLPYVSRASYSHTLGLGSLEILSVTGTEFTPGGMVTGQTFKHSYTTDGQIQHIAVEVLQITNYVPYSRILVVSDSGTLQQWQGEKLQWERNEDLALVQAIVPYQTLGPQFNELSTNLGQYLSRKTWELVSGFLDLNRPSPSTLLSSSDSEERIWYIGTSTGRLFALYKAKGTGAGQVLWKTKVVKDSIAKGYVIWNQLLVIPHEETKKHVLVASISCGSEIPVKKVVVHVDLLKGKILESIDQHDTSMSVVKSHSLEKKLLTIHDKDLGGSPARFLGNRGALFKYHNPNLAVHLGEGLLVEVYDQKLGSLVWSFQMESTVDRDSVIGALTENWLVLASRDSGPGEMTTVHSIEWYMSSKADVRLDGSSVNLTTCSRAYIVPYAVKALGFSKSRLGVTSRALLVVNEMDQIVSLSRRFLDCRRPYGKPSKEDMEEQLIGYDPVINLDPKTVITGDRQTAGLKKVYSFSTAFESTSAVIGVGLDLFGSVVAPSRRFDQLGDEFNKLQLILTASGLLAGVLGMRPVVKNKQLKRQWYT